MNWHGILIGLGVVVIIGLLHPVVIKVEYYFGKRTWPIFLLLGLGCNLLSLSVRDSVLSALLAVLGFSLFWSIHELFQQERRVERGWYPRNSAKTSKRMKALHATNARNDM